MSLNEIVMLLVVCVLGGGSIVAAGYAWEKRAQIALVLGALRRRFITISFDEFVKSLADDRADRYVDEPVDEVVSRDTNTDMDTAENTTPLHTRVAGLTEREWVHLIASRKRADKWAWTGNKIYGMVGGDRNEVLGWIQEVRNIPEPDPRFPESTRDGRPVASHLQRRGV